MPKHFTHRTQYSRTPEPFRAALSTGLGCSLFALLSVGMPSAFAQPAQGGSAEAPQVEEIVVTAQRREEKLQNVPIAISAFNSEALESRNISNIDGLAGLVPNLELTTGGGFATAAFPVIRGGQVGNSLPYAEPPVGIYVDGVYIAKSSGAVLDLADLDHVEVLRGPQGTLYGRNSLGAMNFVSRPPTGEFGGNLKVGAGDYGERLTRFNLNLPEFARLKIKVSGLFEGHDSYIGAADNPYPNAPSILPSEPRRIDGFEGRDSKAVRVAARYDLNDAVRIDYAFDYSHVEAQPNYFQVAHVDSGGIFDRKSPFYAGVPIYLFVQPTGRSPIGYGSGSVDNAPLKENVTTLGNMLTIDWALDDLTIKSITGERRMSFANSLDLDGTPYPLAASQLSFRYHAFSEELQAIGHTDRFQYTGGLYYFTDRAPTDNPQQFFGTATTTASLYTVTTRAYAAYGQIDYNPPLLDDRLTLMAGGRFSHERRTNDRYLAYIDNESGAATVAIPHGTTAAATFNAFTPTVIAKYAVTEDLNAYAKYAKGFRSGGFTGDATSVVDATTPYGAETVNSYEIGVKSRWLDGRLQVNADYFWETHSNIQLLLFSGILGGVAQSRYQNAGDADIDGLELEIQAIPFDWLRVQGNIGTLDAHFTRFDENGIDTSSRHVVPMAPSFTASLSIDARLAHLDNAGDLHLLLDYAHSNPAYATADYDPYFEIQSYNVVNGTLRLASVPLPIGTLDVSIWSKNLLDAKYKVYGLDFGPSFGGFANSLYAPPRTFGVDASWSF